MAVAWPVVAFRVSCAEVCKCVLCSGTRNAWVCVGVMSNPLLIPPFQSFDRKKKEEALIAGRTRRS